MSSFIQALNAPAKVRADSIRGQHSQRLMLPPIFYIDGFYTEKEVGEYIQPACSAVKVISENHNSENHGVWS